MSTKIIKKHLCEVPFCYAVSAMEIDGRLKYLFATDDLGPCCCIDAETGKKETVWEAPGGTMSIIPLPGENSFLASRNFLPGFTARESEIVKVTYVNGEWVVLPWMKLPYVHRFDLLYRNGTYYFLGCILSTTDKPHAEWDRPGRLVAAEVGENFSPPPKLSVIAEGMTRNHGYLRVDRGTYDEAYTACDEGVFHITPPEVCGGQWMVEKILDKAASDIALYDIDGDGIEELATIEPFHGDRFTIYRKTGNEYEEIYSYPDPTEFLHVVWGGMLGGKPAFLGGCRAANRDFFMLRWEDGEIKKEMIETGRGPSNIFVLALPQEDRILVANRESSEAVVFTIEKPQ